MADPIDIELPPGVMSTPTRASRSANWRETNLMRWVEGRICPIGGWSKMNYPPFSGVIKAIHRWNTESGNPYIAYLCDGHAYVDIGGGEIVDITPVGGIASLSSGFTAGGYGDNTYSYGDYGTVRPDREPTTIVPPLFTVDNWGQNLVFMSSVDGRLLMWDPSTSAKASKVTNSPEGNRTFSVTSQRHVILFGAGGDNNKIHWCDEQDITDWNIADVNSKSGDYDFQPAAKVVSVSKSGSDVVFFTDNNRGYVVSYIGMPYIFSVEPFNAESIPISPTAVIDTPNGCVWASPDGFWNFSARNAVPLNSPVWDWVNKKMDAKVAKFTAAFAVMPEMSELYYFFPEKGSQVNNRYVSFNYRTNVWATGTMHRSCGAKSSYLGYPIMSDGYSVYQHEYGSVYDLLPGESLPWATTHSFNLFNGNVLTSVNNMLPDVGEVLPDEISFSLAFSIVRSGVNVVTDSGPVGIIRGLVGFRSTGRDFQLTIRQNVNRVMDWTMGIASFDAIRRGPK